MTSKIADVSVDITEVMPKQADVLVGVKVTGAWRLRVARPLLKLAGRVMGTQLSVVFPEDEPAPSKTDFPCDHRKILRLGTGILPVFMSDGLHSYRVTKDPLPANTNIVGVTMGENMREVVLLLESPDFPAVPENEPYPELLPLFETVEKAV